MSRPWPKWAIWVVGTVGAGAAVAGWGLWKGASLAYFLQAAWLTPLIAAAIVFSPAIARRRAAIEAAESAKPDPPKPRRDKRRRRR